MRDRHEGHRETDDARLCCAGLAMQRDTIRAVGRLVTAVLSALDTYGESGCATCRENARALLTQLRRVAVEADDDERGSSMPGRATDESPRFTA